MQISSVSTTIAQSFRKTKVLTIRRNLLTFAVLVVVLMFKDYEVAALVILGLSYRTFPFTEKEREARLSETKTAYRKSASSSHPDRGGSAEAFRRVRDAYEVVTTALREKRAFVAPVIAIRTVADEEYILNHYESSKGRLQNQPQFYWRPVLSTSSNLGPRASIVRKSMLDKSNVTEVVNVETPFEEGCCSWFFSLTKYHRCCNEAKYAIYMDGKMTTFCQEHQVTREELLQNVADGRIRDQLLLEQAREAARIRREWDARYQPYQESVQRALTMAEYREQLREKRRRKRQIY